MRDRVPSWFPSFHWTFFPYFTDLRSLIIGSCYLLLVTPKLTSLILLPSHLRSCKSEPRPIAKKSFLKVMFKISTARSHTLSHKKCGRCRQKQFGVSCLFCLGDFFFFFFYNCVIIEEDKADSTQRLFLKSLGTIWGRPWALRLIESALGIKE